MHGARTHLSEPTGHNREGSCYLLPHGRVISNAQYAQACNSPRPFDFPPLLALVEILTS